jgi:pullulanase
VLQPAPKLEARALWLNARNILWPGAGREGVFKLYRSTSVSLHVEAGKRVEGALDAFPLTPVKALPAARYRYAGDGPVLTLASEPSSLFGQFVLVRENAGGIVQEATGLQIAGALDDRYAAAENEAALGATWCATSSPTRTPSA